jgi:nicotinamidase/pyrazinamidase
MNPRTTLFYDVDTQRDFLEPGGRLYVKGADRIIPALERLTAIARERGCRIVASVDRHFPGDPELKRNGGEFDDHCMDGTSGQQKIAATAPRNPYYLENRELSGAELDAALAHRGELVIEKQRFDVFAGNRHARSVLARILRDYTDVVVYGVYAEVCVNDAIRGLLELGPKIHAVTDAIADIGAEGARCREQWRAAGVELLTLDELAARLRPPA